MRTFGSFLAVGILALAAGCGGSSSTTVDGGGGAAGGGGGAAGGGGGAAGGASGTCNYPSCLASLATSCQPSGTCFEQVDTTTFATNTCYSNGVKIITALDLTSGSATVTFKNGSTTCYTFVAAASATGAETLTVKNAAGATIATGTSDTTGTATTITCTGGSPVTLNAACQGAMGGTSSSSTCTTGTCTP